MNKENRKNVDIYYLDEIINYENNDNTLNEFFDDKNNFKSSLDVNNCVSIYDLYKNYFVWTIDNNMPTESMQFFYDAILKSGVFCSIIDESEYVQYIENNDDIK